MPKIKTRFAPSPTGYLHIGGLRTAFFAYLTAKSQNGELILRIEDTDQKREVSGAAGKLVEILAWAGIEFDSGPGIGGPDGPYVQSKRGEIYRRYQDELLASGQAYPCFCSTKRLQAMREQQQAEKKAPRYDRRCRDLSAKEADERIKAGEPFVIRQKMPLSAAVKVKDEIRGEIEFRAADLEDHVLIKSSGLPTYQFASVVDDHLMGITHVVRGEEWLPSFPKNLLLYRAFGWEPPKFVHLPLVLNKGGGKLSKRTNDVSVEDFRAKGYLPQALLNFVALLGWSPYAKPSASNAGKKNPEILSQEELVEKFEIKHINASPAVFDQEKLDYLNGYYIRQLPSDELTRQCRPFLEKYWQERQTETDLSEFGPDYMKNAIGLEQERMKRLDEIGELTEFFFVKYPKYGREMLVWKKMDKAQIGPNLEKISALAAAIPESAWTKHSIEDAVAGYLSAKELKVGEYLWPMRVALTGRKASPGPFEVAAVLGKEKTIERLKKAVEISASP